MCVQQQHTSLSHVPFCVHCVLRNTDFAKCGASCVTCTNTPHFTSTVPTCHLYQHPALYQHSTDLSPVPTPSTLSPAALHPNKVTKLQLFIWHVSTQHNFISGNTLWTQHFLFIAWYIGYGRHGLSCSNSRILEIRNGSWMQSPQFTECTNEVTECNIKY